MLILYKRFLARAISSQKWEGFGEKRVRVQATLLPHALPHQTPDVHPRRCGPNSVGIPGRITLATLSILVVTSP
jgi:hypothetical protein